jgi:hypothetical protein
MAVADRPKAVAVVPDVLEWDAADIPRVVCGAKETAGVHVSTYGDRTHEIAGTAAVIREYSGLLFGSRVGTERVDPMKVANERLKGIGVLREGRHQFHIVLADTNWVHWPEDRGVGSDPLGECGAFLYLVVIAAHDCKRERKPRMPTENRKIAHYAIEGADAPNSIIRCGRCTVETYVQPDEFTFPKVLCDLFRDEKTVCRQARVQAVLYGRVDDLQQVMTQ